MTDRDYFPGPIDFVLLDVDLILNATRPPADAPTLAQVVEQYAVDDCPPHGIPRPLHLVESETL